MLFNEAVTVGKKSREEWDKGLDATVKNKLEITSEETSRPYFEVLSRIATEEDQKTSVGVTEDHITLLQWKPADRIINQP